MPLPRNVTARNKNTHTKNAKNRDHVKKTSELDTICDKHQIGNLSFRSCKFASAEGNVTFIEHECVRGNMKLGALIIRAKELLPSSDVIYDLVRLEKEKLERDENKKNEEAEKIRDEMQRLQNANALETLPVGNEHHNELLQTLINKCNMETINESSNDETNNQQTNEISNDQQSTEITIDNQNDSFERTSDENTFTSDENNREKTQLEQKRLNALKQMRHELDKKVNDKSGNKFYRKFMKDIKSKFVLVPDPNIKYLEVKAETTDMVIDNTKAYRIIMPDKIKEQYIMFIGHLQMKSGLLREIDPTIGFDKISRDHSDLLERIKAKENSKITEHNENFIDDEFDDLEDLCVSDDDNIIEDNEESNDQTANNIQ